MSHHHLLATACKLAEQKANLLHHLRHTTSALEDLSRSTGLSASQFTRLQRAKQLVAEMDELQQSEQAA